MHRRFAINAYAKRSAAGYLAASALATALVIAGASAAAAAPQLQRTHGSETQTLMPMPAADASLMPLPDGAPAPSPTVDDALPSESSDGMAGMGDGHSDSAASMPYIATPDAPQRRLVLAGFAAANALVITGAAYMRRKIKSNLPAATNSRAGTPARAPRNSMNSDGGAA